jgi:outer membrane protein TolC
LSWTLNDTFTSLGATAEANARATATSEQRMQLREALRIEVANAYFDVQKAVANIDAAERGAAAAVESLRVRQELFRNGKATAAELVDTETELTRARLRQLEARIGLLVGKTRLEHATGRDTALSPRR